MGKPANQMGQQGLSLDLAERESQLFLKLKLKTILTSKVLDLINPMEPTDPMVSVDLVEREAQNNLQVLKLKSILKAKLAKIVDPMKLDDLLGLVDSIKFGQAEEPIDEMDLADMEPADFMN